VKIAVEGVTKTFTQRKPVVHALAETSFEVMAQEFLCILGPSGCGKSTLLSIIAGIVAPSTGRVLCDGVAVTEPAAVRTVVFQDYALFPWMSVRRNVAFGLEAKGMPSRQVDARVGELLAMVGLDEFASSYPHQLSGGMRQRVALARALAPDPEVVLLDEPFAALDLLTREMMQEEMHRLRKLSGKTFILITHSVEEAVFLGTRVLLMGARPGRIRRDLKIELPDDRPADIRTENARFLHYREELSHALRQELGSAMSG
jgi:NitT/TauT family transport system ATP-binding protein